METTDVNMNVLPLEIFVEILKYIDGDTLGRCRRVCRQWKERIDNFDYLWQEMCRKEFKYSSKIAKRKAGNDCAWYHIFKNLKQWSDLTKFEKRVKEFCQFRVHDRNHILDVDYGVLPLRDSKGTTLCDTTTFKYIPIGIPLNTCYRIANNNRCTVVQVRSGLVIQRSVDSANFKTEEYFRADNFVLTNDAVYFYFNKNIYKCDLRIQNLTQELIFKCEYYIRSIQYSDEKLHLFTENGYIINVDKNYESCITPIQCPIEWMIHLKHLRAYNDTNFVCYSRNIFKIETDNYQHLYLEFPQITALFFYVDFVLIGTRAGEILLYRLSSQRHGARPIFEMLATLPYGKYAVQLDICERRTGPTIVAATFLELYCLDINFFPHEQTTKQTFSMEKYLMYERFFRLKTRLSHSEAIKD